MALVAGDLIYLAVNSGFMAHPPLFGCVLAATELNGPPDIPGARVVFENGQQANFEAEALTRLVEIAADPAEASILGSTVTVSGFTGLVARSFYRDPSGANVRTVLIASERGQAPEAGFTARHSGWLVAAYG